MKSETLSTTDCNTVSEAWYFVLLIYTHGKHFPISRDNPYPVTAVTGDDFFWEVWIQSRSHQIELDCHVLIAAGDQLNGERINWIQARKPSPAVVWHWSIQLQERGEEERVQGEGGGRERVTAMRVKEDDGEQDGTQTANEEGNSDAARCLHRNRKRKLILKSRTVCLVCCKCFVIQNLTALWMTEDNFPGKRYWTARLKGEM